jgi:DNA-directed RNA polymerase specialized sigma24 family protein
MVEYKEIRRRIEVLHKEHGVWLIQSATNITKNREEAEDLVGDLYIYLLEKGTPKIYYKDSINALYCYRFLQTRWINKVVKRDKVRISGDIYHPKYEPIDEEYSSELDEEIMKSFELVQQELQRLSITREWSKVRLFELYYGSEDTMVQVANKIGICKSTMFMNIKKVREHLKKTCPNPFQNV